MLTSCYDSFLKYNEQSSLLDEYGIQDIKYNTFDNKFKGIKQEKLNKFFVDKPLSLSYSSMSVYYKCPFAFYLKRILKIDEFESNMGTRLGTYAHAVLERSYLPDFVFEEVVDEEINKNAIDAKDEFYFNRIKNLLANTIAFNQEHEEVTPFVNHELEKNVKLDFDDFHFEGYRSPPQWRADQGLPAGHPARHRLYLQEPRHRVPHPGRGHSGEHRPALPDCASASCLHQPCQRKEDGG